MVNDVLQNEHWLHTTGKTKSYTLGVKDSLKQTAIKSSVI